MTPAAWAYTAMGLILAACAAIAITGLRNDRRQATPPHDRLRLTRAERAAWHALTGPGLRRQLTIAWYQAHIDLAEQRLRGHLAEEGGDP